MKETLIGHLLSRQGKYDVLDKNIINVSAEVNYLSQASATSLKNVYHTENLNPPSKATYGSSRHRQTHYMPRRSSCGLLNTAFSGKYKRNPPLFY